MLDCPFLSPLATESRLLLGVCVRVCLCVPTGFSAGTSGFLSVSDSDCTVPAVLGQESHASSCLRNGILVASQVVPGVSGPLSSCV